MKKKNSNVISTNSISVKIFDGLTLICGSDNFSTPEAARDSAQRIIEHQKKIMGESMTAYAMVFQNKQLLYYFD